MMMAPAADVGCYLLRVQISAGRHYLDPIASLSWDVIALLPRALTLDQCVSCPTADDPPVLGVTSTQITQATIHDPHAHLLP